MEQPCREPAARSRDYERTYLEYYRLMFRLARDILGSDDLAEDAVSDALVKLYEHYDCVESPTGPKTKRFVSVLAEHAAIDLRRKRKRERTVPLEAAMELQAPVDDAEGRMDLEAALACLPNEQRTAILLSLSCGLSAKQVAENLKCSVSRAEKLISRGKAALRKKIKEVEP